MYRVERKQKPLKNHIEVNDSLIMKNFVLCYVNKGKPIVQLNKEFEDSVINQMINSFEINGLKVIREDGYNLVNCDLCKNDKPAYLKTIREQIIDGSKDNSFFSNKENEILLFPVIEIREMPAGTASDRSTSISIFLRLSFFLIKENQIVFQKIVRLNGIENPWYIQSEKDWENDDYSNIPIDNHIQPAHWDTLVGLGMKEYIERLNRIE